MMSLTGRWMKSDRMSAWTYRCQSAGKAAPKIVPLRSVRPDGVYHRWREVPPRELSIDLVADERLERVTVRAEAS
jgi:hypothetical protein